MNIDPNTVPTYYTQQLNTGGNTLVTLLMALFWRLSRADFLRMSFSGPRCLCVNQHTINTKVFKVDPKKVDPKGCYVFVLVEFFTGITQPPD